MDCAASLSPTPVIEVDHRALATSPSFEQLVAAADAAFEAHDAAVTAYGLVEARQFAGEIAEDDPMLTAADEAVDEASALHRQAVERLRAMPARTQAQALDKFRVLARYDPGQVDGVSDIVKELFDDLFGRPSPPPSPTEGFAALVAARDAAEEAMDFYDLANLPAQEEAFRAARDAFLRFPVSAPADQARKLFDMLSCEVGRSTMTRQEIHDRIVEAADNHHDIQVRTVACVYVDLVRLAAVYDPVAASLDRAEAAHTGRDTNLSDAFWAELDGEIYGDPTTPRGLAWRAARARECLNSLQGYDHSADPAEVQRLVKKASAELDSILRMTARMGVEGTLPLLACCPEECFQPGQPIAPLIVPAVFADRVAYDAAYARHLTLEDGYLTLSFATAEEEFAYCDECGRAEEAWLATPSPTIRDVIAKMEHEEAHRDSMGRMVAGKPTEAEGEDSGANRPRGFLCPAWVAHLTAYGDGMDRARLAIFRDLLRLAGIDNHPADGACFSREDVRARFRANGAYQPDLRITLGSTAAQ